MANAAKTILDPIGSGLGAIVGSLFGKGGTPDVTAPTLDKPRTMPTPDDEEVRRAKRRSISDQLARRGRASTILTGDDALGG